MGNQRVFVERIIAASPVGWRPAGDGRAAALRMRGGPFPSILALALLAPVCGLSQSQTLTLNAPPPSPVASVSAQASTSGTGFFCYWVVAIYPIGKAYPTGPSCVNNAAGTITVNWGPAAAATGYDVLRQATRTLPSGVANSSVAVNVACCSQSDTLGALSSYTVSGASPAQATLRLDNQAGPQAVVVADTPLGFGTSVLKPTTGVTRFANAINWVFEGDSLTAGHGLARSADNTGSCTTSLADATCLDWPSQFVLMSSVRGRVASKTIVATSGATIAIMQARYTASVHPLSPAVTGIPAVLSLWVGANDIAFISPATWEAAVTTYLAAAKVDGFTIIFWTVQRRGDLADSTGVDDSVRLLYNTWIRSQANAGVFDYLVDVDRLMTNPFDLTNFQSDTIHETAAAQYLIARYVNGIFWSDSITLPVLSTDSPQGSGLGNVILNVDAGGNLTTGTKNFFGGWWAGRLATTSADNTFLGWNAGRAVTTQFSNTAVGALAFQTATGSQNTAVGHESANFVSGNNNTCIGFRACFTVVAGANNSALGQGADFAAGTNNAVQLGTGANVRNNSLQFRTITLADDTGVVYLKGFTVGTLLACGSTVPQGGTAFVTDATGPTYNAALTGGGAVVVPVFCDGTIWRSH
jgi:hypothetical protein